MKKVLVTGAGGFIGSHLVEGLVRKGHQVRALVRYNSRGSQGWLEDISKEIRSQVEIVPGDLRDADRMLAVVEGREWVFHLGAMISIPYSYVSPGEATAVNVLGTKHVLDAARAHGVARVVHTSSSEVYGTALYVPIDEKHPLQGQSPYSASKIGADQLAQSYYRSFDVPVVTIRPFNTYGPRQSARAVIPTILVQLLSGEELKLGALTPTRDFTFVSDTVAGLIRGAEASGVLGETLNLGVGSEISIGDLVKLMGEVLGRDVSPSLDKARLRPEKSEVNRLLSKNELARERLDWAPQVSLREGLEQTKTWLESHLDHYRRAQSEYLI